MKQSMADKWRKCKTIVEIWTRSLAVLCFLGAFFPCCFIVSIGCWVISKLLLSFGIIKLSTKTSDGSKSILILAASKCKALHMARLFKAEGYITILCETTRIPVVSAGWSNYCDYFYKLTDPLDSPNEYLQEVIGIAKKHATTFFLPLEPRHVPWDIEVISKISEFCMPITADEETLEELDNKFKFCQCLQQLNLRAPVCEYITHETQVLEFIKDFCGDECILKPIIYDGYQRGSINLPKDPKKLKAYLETKNISEKFPYVLQNRLEQPELASCTLVIRGKIVAHTVGYSSPVHQSFDHIYHPEITEWVQEFVRRYPKTITGWLCFDFMKSPEDGHFYPFECNPRLSSSYILFQKSDDIVKAIERHLDKNHEKTRPREADKIKPIEPSVKQVFWLMNELWMILANLNDLKVIKERLRILWTGKEAVFEFKDPLPFLVLSFVHMPALIVKNLLTPTPFRIVDYCCSSLKY